MFTRTDTKTVWDGHVVTYALPVSTFQIIANGSCVIIRGYFNSQNYQKDIFEKISNIIKIAEHQHKHLKDNNGSQPLTDQQVQVIDDIYPKISKTHEEEIAIEELKKYYCNMLSQGSDFDSRVLDALENL